VAEPLRALIVSYAFPPVGGAGVQRVSKLVKYLGEHGVMPSVLTVANPSVPLVDKSLAHDIPPDTEIVRARTFEPGYQMKRAAWSASSKEARPTLKSRAVRALTSLAKNLLVPDPQVLWQPAAQAALARRLAAGKDDVVFVSGPPFSQFLIAPLMRLNPRVGLVLDYRDEWSTYRSSYEMMGKTAEKAGDVLERAILKRAHYVTTATAEFREHLLSRYSFLTPDRVIFIPNGYDPDDFPRHLPRPSGDKLLLTYAGTIFKLTSPRGLLGAIKRLPREVTDKLEVRFIGRIVDTELAHFEGVPSVARLGYVPHEQVLPELAQSDMNLCILDDVPGNEAVYPGKIFELMYLGRRILSLTVSGACSRLVESHDLGRVLHPRDEQGIARFLAESVANLPLLRAADPRVAAIGRYHRRSLAGEFAEVMRWAGAARRTS
jgi:glycosyltransferase involved in cell wall biosynthesis